ncbi:cell division protein FtsQ/DivIB, partial [Oleiphilus sp. HI0123]
NAVREETVLVLKRVLTVTLICLALLVLLTKRDSLIQVVDHPISSIKVTGAFSYLNESEVTQALSGLVGAGFIATDLKDVQTRVEGLAWVNSATVSRVWPGEIKLLINEQVAVSQWNDGALLNAEGVVFKPAELR